jgi:outer membrane biosynthesis protein TonB
MPRALTLFGLTLLAGVTIAAAALAQQSAPAPEAKPVAPEQPVPPAPPPSGVPAEQMPGSPPPPPSSPVLPAEQAPAPSPPSSSSPVAPAEQAPPPSPPVVPAEQVASAELTGLLGEEVVGPGGTELGHIVDLLVDTQGRMRAVVVDVGGFMGVGSRKVAVAWSAVRFTSGPKGPVVSIVIPLDRIKSWAEYIAGRPVAILGAPGSTP